MLKSLYASGYPNLEVIVVDNASPSDNPDIIKERYPQIVFIKNPVNGGFANGNNIGIRQAKGQYLFMINNDTEVPAGTIERLVEVLAADPQTGLVCPKIKYFDDRDIIQYAGQTKMSTFGMRSFIIGYGEKDTGQYEKSKETYYVHGSAMMTTKEVISKVGMLPEAYFLYYEELDWCDHIRKAGYKLMYVHNAVMYHKESLSTGKNSPLKTYYLKRNRMIFLRRNRSGITRFIAMMYLLLIAYPKNMIMPFLKGDFKNARSVARAYGWGLRHLFDTNILN
jgi:GT2 family glycosyltransferase